MKEKICRASKIILCMLLMIIACIFQSAFSAKMNVWGRHIDFLPMLTAVAGMTLGGTGGMVCGLTAGILYDVCGNAIEGIYPLYFMIWGIVCSSISTRISRYRGVWTAVCSLSMTAMWFLIRYLFYFQFETEASLWTFSKNALICCIVTFIFTPLLYHLFAWIAREKTPRIQAAPDA